MDFSEEELLDFEEASLRELSEKDLSNVSGGVSIKSSLLAGGILSMVLLGGVGLTSHAMDPEPPSPAGKQQQIQSSNMDNKSSNTNKTVHGEIFKTGNYGAEGNEESVK